MPRKCRHNSNRTDDLAEIKRLREALDEVVSECHSFVEAYGPEFFPPYPPGYVYKPEETRAAAVFAHGRFKVLEQKLLALVAAEAGEV